MTQWMKSQFDATAGAANSGLDAYISNFLSGRGYSNNDEFLKTFKGQEDLEVPANSNGTDLDLSSISIVQLSSTDTYNLSSSEKATSTVNHLTTLLQNLATQRANIGANLSRVEIQSDMLDKKYIQEKTKPFQELKAAIWLVNQLCLASLDLKLNF